jgi:5-formyltetrahydrofolate cyclo-ligase
MAALRDSLPEEEQLLRSTRLCETVEHQVLDALRRQLGRPLRVCLYAPFRSEASPLPLLLRCRQLGDSTFAPRILPNEEGMELRKVEVVSHWIPGRWGVPEPDPLQTEKMDSDLPLDAVLVPGLVYNEAGGRLGYGGGYYDRLYEKEQGIGYRTTHWIGFAYNLQVVEDPLPMEPHDLKLDALVTEERVIRFKKEGQ